MSRHSILLSCIFAICALVLIASPVEGNGFFRKDAVKRQTKVGGSNSTAASAPVNETQFLTTACNDNPQENFAVCVEELTGYVNSSAAAWCQHQQEVLDDCLVPNDYNPPDCSAQVEGYEDCANYTLSIYTNCLASFSMPSYLYACANVDLFQGAPNPSTTSIATSTLPTNPLSTISTLTGPITFSETTSSANNATPTVFGTAPTATLSSNSSSSSRVARSTLTVTEVVTATACPPDITDCPARSTFLSTITTTSVSTAGGGAANSSATNPTSIPTSTSTETQQSTLTIISTYWTDEVITITYAESTVPYYTTYPILTTLYSCPGGCTGGPIYGAAATSTIPATSVQTATVSVAADTNVCGLKKRTRILRRDEV